MLTYRFISLTGMVRFVRAQPLPAIAQVWANFVRISTMTQFF